MAGALLRKYLTSSSKTLLAMMSHCSSPATSSSLMWIRIARTSQTEGPFSVSLMRHVSQAGPPRFQSWSTRRASSLPSREGNRRIPWYALRHTFATECVLAGVDEPTLQRLIGLMGHKHGSTVTRRYVHTDASRLSAAVDWA